MPENNCGCSTNSYKSFPKVNTFEVPCIDGCPFPSDASCITYTGEPLTNIGLGTNEKLDVILAELAAQIGQGGEGSWDYNYYCLDDTITIDNRKTFVETISQRFCTLASDVTTINTRLEDYETLVQTVDDIENPGITTSAFIGINANDDYFEILNKLITSINTLNSHTTLTGVNWGLIYTPITTPTNVAQGFNEILRQMQLILNSGSSAVLPTFNTSASCLPTKTSTTPLVTVINELVTADCDNAKFNFSSVTWGCVVAPVTETFQASFQKAVFVLGSLVEEKPVFDPAVFDVVPLTNCQGYSVTLQPNILQSDGLVFVNAASTTKQYLSQALENGTNTVVQVVGDKIRINANVGDLDKVSVISGGANGYLDQVLQTGISSNGEITLNKTLDGSGNLLITPTINEDLLADTILTAIRNNPALLAKLCNMMCSCDDCS